MNRPTAYLSPAEAARQLGVSVKALRLYEEHHLLTPARTQAGWRAYGPTDMQRAREVTAMRSLGLSLSEISRVLRGDEAATLPLTLEAHQASLEARMRDLSSAIGRVHDLRSRIARGEPPSATELASLHAAPSDIVAAFDLPWPWGGERFELRKPKPITYLTGPLFSGKTRLAHCMANTVPGAVFIGLERRNIPPGATPERIEQALTWLREDGATSSDALIDLVRAFEAEGPTLLVIDLVEQGLDEATQLSLIAFLRRRAQEATPVVLMTRSNAILDLASVGPDEAILFCPANHGPPVYVTPHPGAAGYEAVASCLASPEVRARTEGVIAIRPPAA